MESSLSYIILTYVLVSMIHSVIGYKSNESQIKSIFLPIDYAMVGVLIFVSCGVGVFFTIFKMDNNSSKDFLLGGSNVHLVPMAFSLSSSFVTGIELLGNPAETYLYGTMYWLICVSFFIIVPITIKFYLPVFTKLRLTSCYEYLELRFSKPIRITASLLYQIQTLLYASVAVYATASALTNVTGIHKYLVVFLIYIICSFYSTVGGLKAVIISDSFQATVLMTSLLFVIIHGLVTIGDVETIITHAFTTDRLEFFNFDYDMTERHTFWSIVIGGSFYWASMFCANQASVQKYLSVAKNSHVQIALWFSCITLTLIYSISFFTGMIILYYFRNCDPIKNGEIPASDQLLPFYVGSAMKNLPGAIGLVVSGILAASLGTVAAALTSISATFLQDIVSCLFERKIPESQEAKVARTISVMSGLISYLLVFAVERFKSILQLAITINGIAGGINLGLFTLGIFFPKANARGAVIGMITALCIVITIGTGSLYHIVQGDIVDETKQVSIADCEYNNTITANGTLESLKQEINVFPLFKLSYLWYTPIGCIITVVVGLLTSYVTESFNVDPDLLSPPIVNFLRKLEAKFELKFNIKKAETVKTIKIQEDLYRMNTDRF